MTPGFRVELELDLQLVDMLKAPPPLELPPPPPPSEDVPSRPEVVDADILEARQRAATSNMDLMLDLTLRGCMSKKASPLSHSRAVDTIGLVVATCCGVGPWAPPVGSARARGGD